MKISILPFLLIIGLNVFAQNFEKIEYEGIETRSSKKKPPKICAEIEVPKGGKVSEFSGAHFGETGKAVTYEDGSVIYISNAYYDGTTLNLKNRVYSNEPRKPGIDTLDSYGLQKDSQFWREKIIGKLVVGYYNVPPDKKELYDKSIATLNRKK